MPSTPTPRLRAELQALGENLNTWGDGRLNAALTRLEEAIADVVPIAITGTSYVLTSTNYVADEARGAALVITGTLTGNATITAPTVEKLYLIDNRTTQGAYSLTIKTAAGTGYALRPGPQKVFCDGTDFARGEPRLDQVPLPAAAVDMNGQRLTNLPTPSANSDSATKKYVDDTAFAAAGGNLPGQAGNSGRLLTTDGSVAGWGPRSSDLYGDYWGGVAGGTANALTAMTGYGLPALYSGLIVGAKTGVTANSGAATLNVDGLGAKPIQKNGAALTGGELPANTDLWFQYDGTNWRLLGGSGTAFLAGAITKASAYTVALTDNKSMLECTGTWTLSLPAVASALAGFTLVVSNTGSGTITVDPNGSELINNALLLSIPPHLWAILICDGTSWRVMMAINAAAASGTTWSPTDKAPTITLSNNNLTATSSGAANQLGRASAAIPAGAKVYWEVLVSTLPGGTSCDIGIADASTATNSYVGATANSYSYSVSGNKNNNGSGTAYGSAFGATNVIGVALDLVSMKIYFRKDGVWQGSGDPVAGTGAAFTVSGGTTYYPSWSTNGSSGAATAVLKASITDLVYPPPSGYSVLL